MTATETVLHRIGRDERQTAAWNWAAQSFGDSHVMDLKVRTLRVLEEAIELYQSLEGDEATAHKLLAHIFTKPLGEPKKELGGLSVTMLVLATSLNTSLDACEVIELNRVLSKPLEHWRERNERKNALGFDGIAPAEDVPVDKVYPDYRMILLNLAYSLTLSDHLGDVKEDMDQALKLAGVELPDTVDDDDTLRVYLETLGALGLYTLRTD